MMQNKFIEFISFDKFEFSECLNKKKDYMTFYEYLLKMLAEWLILVLNGNVCDEKNNDVTNFIKQK